MSQCFFLRPDVSTILSASAKQAPRLDQMAHTGLAGVSVVTPLGVSGRFDYVASFYVRERQAMNEVLQ
jgi:hypothetical protein